LTQVILLPVVSVHFTHATGSVFKPSDAAFDGGVSRLKSVYQQEHRPAPRFECAHHYIIYTNYTKIPLVPRHLLLCIRDVGVV